MTTLKLLTIITEALVAKRLITDLEGFHVSGYTISEVEGKGSSNLSASDWEGRNKKIEILLSNELAERILEHVQNEYFENYSVVAYLKDVQVIRSEKFTA